MSNCSCGIYRIRKQRQKLADRLTTDSSVFGMDCSEWNTFFNRPSRTLQFLYPIWCFTGHIVLRWELARALLQLQLFWLSPFTWFDVCVRGWKLVSSCRCVFRHKYKWSMLNETIWMLEDGNQYSMERWGCWVVWQVVVNVVNGACNKQSWFKFGRADYSVVVVFSAQLIRNTSLNILNSFVSNKEPFQANSIDQSLFPCVRVYH